MKILSAREMFKEEEKRVGAKSYWTGEQRVIKYGKITKTIAFRIIERTKYIENNSQYNVEILKMKDDGRFELKNKPFKDDSEPDGGRIVGKYYKGALLKANEYISKERLNSI